MMRMFVERAEVSLLEVNDLLRSTSSATSETQVLKAVDGAYRRIHAIKGDAASMGLEILASLAHQFESELQKTQGQRRRHWRRAAGPALATRRPAVQGEQPSRN